MTSMISRVRESAGAVLAQTKLRPSVAVVLGSGLAPLARLVDRPAARLPFASLPHWPETSVQGHGRELVLGHAGPVPVAIATGRAHGYEGHTASQTAFPIRVLASLGARAVILTSAAGSTHPANPPADLLLVEDHVNLTGTNPLVGPHEDGLGSRFPDLTDLYDPELRQLAEQACWKVGVRVRKGVYAAFLGPSYETPAEVRMARTLGADAVGMSIVSEAIVARQCGLRVLALSCLTNLAAGVSRQPLSHQEVLVAAQRSRGALADLLGRLLPAVERAVS